MVSWRGHGLGWWGHGWGPQSSGKQQPLLLPLGRKSSPAAWPGLIGMQLRVGCHRGCHSLPVPSFQLPRLQPAAPKHPTPAPCSPAAPCSPTPPRPAPPRPAPGESVAQRSAAHLALAGALQEAQLGRGWQAQGVCKLRGGQRRDVKHGVVGLQEDAAQVGDERALRHLLRRGGRRGTFLVSVMVFLISFR